MEYLGLIQHLLGAISISVGLLFCIIGVVGVYRLSDIYCKQHATGLIDTAGIFFICLGLSIKSGFVLVSIKPILLAILIAMVSAPTSYTFMEILINRKEDTILSEVMKKREKDANG